MTATSAYNKRWPRTKTWEGALSPVTRKTLLSIAFITIGLVISVATAAAQLRINHNICERQDVPASSKIENYGLPFSFFRENNQCELTSDCQAINCPPSLPIQSIKAVELNVTTAMADVIFWTIIPATFYIWVKGRRYLI
jgi:hypothetical protein